MIRLFRVFIPVGTVTLLLSEILLISVAFLLSTYLVLPVEPTAYLLYDGGLLNIAIVIMVYVLVLYFQDLYSNYLVESRIQLAQDLSVVIGITFLLHGVVSYVDRDLRVSMRVMVLGSILAILSMYIWRIIFSTYALRAMGRTGLLLVGSSPLLETIARFIERHPEKGLCVNGYVADELPAGSMLPGGKILGGIPELRSIVESTNPHRIVVGMSERRNRMPVSELLSLRLSGRIIEEAPDTYERICNRVSVSDLRPAQLIYSGELGPRPRTLFYQAAGNIAVATVLAILASPIILLTALAVRLTSAGPILYRQKRVGLHGVPFTVYKFRSMRVDAEAKTGAVWATKDDPRITPVGRIIRKIRFDELPQLFNVVRGEMSLVGPRPERPEFVKVLTEKIPYYHQRHCVRPGITGWAQINYKYGDTFEDTITKLEYDLYYIKHLSLSLDTYIILHTAKAMLLSRGAQ